MDARSVFSAMARLGDRLDHLPFNRASSSNNRSRSRSPRSPTINADASSDDADSNSSGSVVGSSDGRDWFVGNDFTAPVSARSFYTAPCIFEMRCHPVYTRLPWQPLGVNASGVPVHVLWQPMQHPVRLALWNLHEKNMALMEPRVARSDSFLSVYRTDRT